MHWKRGVEHTVSELNLAMKVFSVISSMHVICMWLQLQSVCSCSVSACEQVVVF